MDPCSMFTLSTKVQGSLGTSFRYPTINQPDMFPCLLQLPNQHFVEFWVIYEGLHHFVFDRFSSCPENRSFCSHSYYDSGIQRRTPKPVLSESVDDENSENSLLVQISPSDLALSRVFMWSKLPRGGRNFWTSAPIAPFITLPILRRRSINIVVMQVWTSQASSLVHYNLSTRFLCNSG